MAGERVKSSKHYPIFIIIGIIIVLGVILGGKILLDKKNAQKTVSNVEENANITAVTESQEPVEEENIEETKTLSGKPELGNAGMFCQSQ